MAKRGKGEFDIEFPKGKRLFGNYGLSFLTQNKKLFPDSPPKDVNNIRIWLDFQRLNIGEEAFAKLEYHTQGRKVWYETIYRVSSQGKNKTKVWYETIYGSLTRSDSDISSIWYPNRLFIWRRQLILAFLSLYERKMKADKTGYSMSVKRLAAAIGTSQPTCFEHIEILSKVKKAMGRKGNQVTLNCEILGKGMLIQDHLVNWSDFKNEMKDRLLTQNEAEKTFEVEGFWR